MLSERNLDDAISALKSELPGEALSESSRATIFDAARRSFGVFESLAFFFPRSRTIVLAVSFPLVLTLTLLFSLPHSVTPGRHPVKITASKDDGNVVFTVANGRSEHRVFKSTDPARFGAKEVPVVRGRFSDRSDNGLELVFYRVD